MNAAAADKDRLDHPDLQDLMVRTVRMVAQASLDQMALTLKRDKGPLWMISASHAPMPQQDLAANRDQKDLRDHPARKDPKGPLDHRDQLDLLDPVDRTELVANRDHLENLDQMVCNTRFPAQLDPRDQPAKWDLRERRAQMVAMASPVAKDLVVPLETMEPMVPMVSTAPTANRDHRERSVSREAAITALRQEPLPDIKKVARGGRDLELDLELQFSVLLTIASPRHECLQLSLIPIFITIITNFRTTNIKLLTR